jgi:uncharacterized protein YbjQ (UPF0145 family)
MMVPPNRMPSWHPQSKGSMPSPSILHLTTDTTETPQSRTPSLLTATTSCLPGHRIIRVLGTAHGTTSAARKDPKSFIRNIAANFSSSWGEAKSVTSIIYQARDQAIERLVKEAIKMGANAVVGVSVRETEMCGCVVVSVSGTAVWVEKEREGSGGVKRDSAQSQSQQVDPFL